VLHLFRPLHEEHEGAVLTSGASWAAMGTNSTDAAEDRAKNEETKRNLASISPFFIVKDLQVSISYYVERLGFQLAFQGPDDDPYYASVTRDGIGIMLKAILPEVLPQPNHTRHEWARWDAYVYTLDPDALFDEFSRRGASFVKELSFIDEGLWGFEVTDADGYVLAFFRLRRD
jgi:catechol 2,3-dioxygenase-like lactoylglutathione lyase family enzyme